MDNNMHSLKKTARFAGLLYFIWVITGIYGIIYVPSKTIVPGDAVATANKILAHEFLFRTSIVNDIVSATIWVFMVLALYWLFKPVNERQAKLLVALVMVQLPALFFYGCT